MQPASHKSSIIFANVSSLSSFRSNSASALFVRFLAVSSEIRRFPSWFSHMVMIAMACCCSRSIFAVEYKSRHITSAPRKISHGLDAAPAPVSAMAGRALTNFDQFRTMLPGLTLTPPVRPRPETRMSSIRCSVSGILGGFTRQKASSSALVSSFESDNASSLKFSSLLISGSSPISVTR